MKSNLMRRLSILLVLALVLSMLPVAAMAADETITVYFQNNWKFTDVKVYYWGSSTSSVDWPGTLMTYVETDTTNGNDIYSAEIPADATGMLFVGQDNGSEHKSVDISPIETGVCYYMNWTEELGEHVGTYTYPVVEETTAAGEEPEVTEPEVTVGNITIYVDAVAANLATPYAWAWGDYGNAFASWPGEAMTLVESAGTVYSITVREDTTNIIFSNNGASQTADLTVAGDNTIWNGTEFVDYSTYTPVGGEVVSYDYYLTGDANLMATAGKTQWDVAAIGLTADENGVYTYVFSDLAAGDYALKVTNGTWNTTWGGTGADGNYEFTVDTACDVTVTFDGSAISVTGAGIGVVTYPPYVVVGNVLGLETESENWAASNGVEMTTADDGVTYTYTFSALAVSPDAETPYEFKIVKDGTTWLPDGDNWKFYVINEASDVTITIVAETAQISINTGDNVVFDYPGTETPDPEIVIDSIIIVGGPNAEAGTTDMGNLLYGQEWNPEATLNAMFLENGVYTVEYMNVPAGTYDIKFVANADAAWTHNWGAGAVLTPGQAATAYYGGGNSTIVVEKDGSLVTFTLDLSNIGNGSNDGTVTVDIAAPEGLETSAPDSLVIGSNDFVLGTGDRNVVSSTFTATQDCTLTINVAAMNAFNGVEMESVPGFFIGMQFGNRYGIVIDGVWLYSIPQTVELTAGQTVEIGFVSFQGNAAELTVVLCDEHNWSDGYCLNCNAACEHDEATHDAANLTVTCATCGKSVTYTGSAIKLNTATLSLADDISVNFHCTVPADAWASYVVFTFNGEETYVYDYTLNEANGRFIYTFPGVLPQTMGDDIAATLYVNIEGMYVAVETSYSVIRYCNSQLKKTTISDEFRTLISDLLAYGAQAQIYTSDTDTLVTDLVEYEMTPSTFPGLDASFNQQAFDESVDKDNYNRFASVALQLENKVVVRLGIIIADPDNSTVEVTIGGETYTYSITELEYNETNGRYYLNFDKVAATQFNEKITCVLKTNDAQVGQTLYYSVNSYVYKKQDAGTVEATLLQMIYNYGKAAEEYAASL